MDKSETQSKAIDLILISFIALFFEILFIRWVPSCVQVMAYFTNAILISCFLGLGLGSLLADVKLDLMRLFPLPLRAGDRHVPAFLDGHAPAGSRAGPLIAGRPVDRLPTYRPGMACDEERSKKK